MVWDSLKGIDYKFLILTFGIARVFDSVSTYLVAERLIEGGANISEIVAVENNFVVSWLWSQTGNIPIGLVLDFIIIVGLAAILIKFATPHIPDVFAFFFVLAGSWEVLYFGFLNNFLLLQGYGLDPYGLIGWIIFCSIGTLGIILHIVEKWKNKQYVKIK